MKKIVLSLTAIALFCTACSSPQDDTGKELSKSERSAQNLVQSGAAWRAAADDFGSTVDTTPSLHRGDRVAATFTLAPKTGDEWPYVELICEPVISFEDIDSAVVTYTSEVPLTVKLAQSDFGPAGDESYAYYQMTLPATDSARSTVVALDALAQPEWAPSAAADVPMKRENATALYFVPGIDQDAGGTAHLSIHSLVLQ